MGGRVTLLGEERGQVDNGKERNKKRGGGENRKFLQGSLSRKKGVSYGLSRGLWEMGQQDREEITGGYETQMWGG